VFFKNKAVIEMYS